MNSTDEVPQNAKENVRCLIETFSSLVKYGDIDLLAVVLDIRSKNSKRLTTIFEEKKKTQADILKQFLLSENIVADSDSDLDIIDTNPSPAKRNKRSLFEDEIEDNDGQDLFENEIRCFLDDKSSSHDLGSWWLKNSEKYKKLSQLSKIYSSTVLTSIPEEFYKITFIQKLSKFAVLPANIRNNMIKMHLNSN